MTEREVCVVCADKIDNARELVRAQEAVEAIADGRKANSGMTRFSRVLRELHENADPGLASMAETILETTGGAAGFAKLMMEDFHNIRGTFLDHEMQALHTPDYKVLQRMYAMLIGLIAERDKQLMDAGDPLVEMSDEELSVVIAEAVRFRLAEDRDYRRECLEAIEAAEPGLIKKYALSKMGVPEVLG